MKKSSKIIKILKTNQAFTIVELVIVMAIIAVLAVLVIGAIQMARKTQRNTQLKNDAKLLKTTVESYYGRTKSFPTAPSAGLGTPNDRNAYALWCASTASGCNTNGPENVLNSYMNDPNNPPTNLSVAAGQKGTVCYNMFPTSIPPYYRIWIVSEEAGLNCTTNTNPCVCGYALTGAEIYGGDTY